VIANGGIATVKLDDGDAYRVTFSRGKKVIAVVVMAVDSEKERICVSSSGEWIG